MKANVDKANEDHAEIFFRWYKHVNREFWTSEEQVLSEMAKIKVVTAKRNELKEKITEYAKGLC